MWSLAEHPRIMFQLCMILCRGTSPLWRSILPDDKRYVSRLYVSKKHVSYRRVFWPVHLSFVFANGIIFSGKVASLPYDTAIEMKNWRNTNIPPLSLPRCKTFFSKPMAINPPKLESEGCAGSAPMCCPTSEPPIVQSSNNSVSASTTLGTHTSRGDNLGAEVCWSEGGMRPVMPSVPESSRLPARPAVAPWSKNRTIHEIKPWNHRPGPCRLDLTFRLQGFLFV